MDTIAIELAQGLFRDGAVHRSATLVPLTGRAEFDLRDGVRAGWPNADLVSRLLASSVVRIGTLSGLLPADAAELTVGDRERLLFALYRLTFGANVDVVARCPDCEEIVELDIPARVAEPPPARQTAIYKVECECDSALWQISFRLPTGGDQARLALAVPEAGGDADVRLLRDCVVEATRNGWPVSIVDPDAEILAAVEDAMRHADPAAESEVEFVCPGCGKTVEVVVDATTLLRGTLMDGRHVLRDVHRLASVYHWTEPDILALTRDRRADYLAMIEEELEA
ncbi:MULTISPECIES: hypothetical protein [unclassified Rhizobium]|uniref:T4 family baseplate hub assembly chaperone n=1 Tax=unclassified Rhizobium TaxID=2613769 RepID=UPI00161C1604|nr:MULTISPECIES: hypothetical protein [unclassified Rhizobium]MBB3543237.1 hypothetical protein [Rhizobium sp. BK399]MCS3741751.1 hypothetical protein [Rhizobium sp. BK661]MCS4093522.1 hypothetical protein [Rhizobium sp. BK176]